ncbi:MAG: caspase family protein, partial [Planctomycetota bacterium]
MSLNILIASFVFFFFSYISVSEVLGESTIPLSPTGHEVSGNQWLFVIGINKYSEWPRLNTAVNDARKVKDILLKRYYFDKYHVIELYDEEATRRNILAKLRYLSRRVGPEVEGSVKDRSSWITNQEIINYLKIDSIKAKHVLLIVDSCFSGGSFSAYRGRLPRVTDKVIQQAYKEASRQVITTGGIKPVIADGFSDNSVFTHFLVKGLEENIDPFLIPSDLFKVIKTGVEQNTDQVPMFGILKNIDKQRKEGELVFFLNDDELERLKELKRQAQNNKVVLRSSYKELSIHEIQSMPHVDIREEME